MPAQQYGCSIHAASQTRIVLHDTEAPFVKGCEDSLIKIILQDCKPGLQGTSAGCCGYYQQRPQRMKVQGLIPGPPGCIPALHLVILVTTARSKQRLTENGWKSNPKIESCFCMWV